MTNETVKDMMFRSLHLPFIKFCEMQSSRTFQREMNSLDSGSIIHRSWDYSKEVPGVRIVIPVYNRKNHLEQSTKNLLSQINDLGRYKDLSVSLVVCEMSKKSEHELFCKNLGIDYLYIPGDVFNKSTAQSISANFFPADNFIFYDVDLITESGWLKSCLDTITKARSDGQNCWVCQPIPARKIYYVSESDTEKIFFGKEKIDSIPKSNHFIQPEWYKNNFPPGGIVLISAELLWAIGGYDSPMFWGYSPEDLQFMKRATMYSQCGLITWDENQADSNVYHLHHPNSESTNLDYEHMILAHEMLDGDEALTAWFSQDKLRWGKFNSWKQGDLQWENGSVRFPPSISKACAEVYLSSIPEQMSDRQVYDTLVSNSRISAMLESARKSNFSVHKIYLEYISYISVWGRQYFSVFRNIV